ncbi:WD40 repeat domain-containing serine/threonine protein kinase [Streptosporangium sp. NPDC050855]|uniref:WD40 repeat domain-containing serine/threonine protein kinase n=1 Tax=Streptosporangium sp. NPDC050855 TaxID=3366194 RepID=UPI0037A8FA44
MSTTLIDGDPQRLGDYWLAGRLGAGGQGVVYEAYDADGRRVAVKVLHGDAGADPELRERFGREAAAARRVSSFCTAGVLDADLDGPRPYIVSEYVEGPSLRKAVAEGRRFTGGDLHRLGTAIATALTAVHEAGVIHRDLKPDNVLLGPDGPRVIDFGIARTIDMSLTATGMVAGTPTYMAPEIFMGQRATTAVDVFAWGGIMVFAATGADPFRAESLGGVMHRVLSVQPQLDILPEHLRPFVAASLAKDPASRPTARDLLLALVSGDGAIDTPRLLAAGSDAGAQIRATSADPALGTLAEDAYAGLGPAERELAPEVFLRLVTVDDDGRLLVRQAQWSELLDGRQEAEAAAVRRLLKVFAYLVTHDEREVWLSRPALPQAWPRLRMWVQANRDGLAVHRGILAAARRWQTQGRKDGDLFQGSSLENAMHWAATGRRNITLSPIERDFLEAGAALTRRRARRNRALSATLAVLLVVALAAGALAVQQSRVADARSTVIASQRDEATAARLAATADTLRVAEPVTAMLLSVAAWRLAPVPEARASLAGSLVQRETATFRDPDPGIQTLRELSADGRTLVSASDGEARFWDVRTGRRVGRVTGLGDDLREIALSPGGRLLAVADGTRLRVWNVRTGRPTGAGLTVGAPGMGGDLGVRFGRSDDWLVITEGEANTVWNLTTGEKRSVPVAGVNFDVSADGTRIVAGGLESTATAFTLDDLRRIPLGGRCACVPNVAYSPDGATVAVLRGRRAELRDASTGAKLDRSFEFDEDVAESHLVFSPDGRFLALATHTALRVWRVRDAQPLLTQRIDAYLPVLAFDPDGRTLRYFTEDAVTALDISGLTDPVTLKGAGTHWAALSPDGRLLASRAEGAGEIVIRDVRSRARKGSLPIELEGASGAFEMAFSGDGRRLTAVTGVDDSELAVWDTATFKRIASFGVTRDGTASALAISADGTAVAAYTLYHDADVEPDGEIHVWDVPGGRLRWSRPQTIVERLAFSPDGGTLAVAGGDHRLLNARTGKPFGQTYGSPSIGIQTTALAFSGDGARFATVDQTMRMSVFETRGRRRVGTLIRGERGTGTTARTGLAYSPRGDVIAAAASERSVGVWDVETGRRLGPPIAVQPGDLRSLAFGSGGDALVLVDSDGTLTEHPVAPAAVARAVCERAGRTLSREEWRAHLGDLPYRDVCPA